MTEKGSCIHVRGFTTRNLNMSDFTICIVPGNDSSSIILRFDIPFVSYTDYNDTNFDFNNLGLFIRPSINPGGLDIWAELPSLNILQHDDDLSLTGLILSVIHEKGKYLNLDINVPTLSYTDFKDTFFDFKGLGFSIMADLDALGMCIFTFLNTLNLVSIENDVDLTDLDMYIGIQDAGLENLDLSIFFSGLNYNGSKDKSLNLTGASLELMPVLNSTSGESSIYNLNLSEFLSNMDYASLDSTGFDLSVLIEDICGYLGINASDIDMDKYDFNEMDVSDVLSLVDELAFTYLANYLV